MKTLELMIFDKGSENCWFDKYVQWIIITENNQLEYMDIYGNNHLIENVKEMEIRVS